MEIEAHSFLILIFRVPSLEIFQDGFYLWIPQELAEGGGARPDIFNDEAHMSIVVSLALTSLSSTVTVLSLVGFLDFAWFESWFGSICLLSFGISLVWGFSFFGELERLHTV